ncbi:MAG: helix-turn-helix domain-containing protein [Clostridiales bacterium]|nr:helix-turn-helix domain-containing protein [Clostridiales bacterium]
MYAILSVGYDKGEIGIVTLGDKLAKLRKENNYTQEQLADILDVSRQSVSKWESDLAYPETDKLIKLGELYNCSMDYLLKDGVEMKDGVEKKQRTTVVFDFKNFYFERKSSRTVHGVPLWHINIGWGRTAKGIIAIGFKAKGIISFGLLSLGVLSFGLLSLGLISLGVFALGLIGLGSISAGFIALGAICFGILAIGAVAVGEFSVGALAVGKYFAMGDHAYAMIAIGKTKAVGSVYQANAITKANYAEVISLLKAKVPEILSWLTALIKPLLRTG